MRNPRPVFLAAAAVILASLCIALYLLYYSFYPRFDSANAAIAFGHFDVAKKYYTEEAELGNPVAQNGLGNLYYLGLGVPIDHMKASSWYFAAASQGFGAAQLNLGHLYSQGLGVPVDAMRAFAWYRMSHIAGNPIAEKYLSQITTEYTLGPMQINTATSKWPTLASLIAEGLR